MSHNEINIIDLYASGNSQAWNAWLTRSLARNDVSSLEKVYNGIQRGAANAAKGGYMDEKLTLWYLRLLKSLELTAKKIYRKKYNVQNMPIEAKRKADLEFEAWLTRARF